MQIPSDKAILHLYLQSVCQAMINHEDQHANRLINKIIDQYAKPGKEQAFKKEIKTFCSDIINEIEDDMGWYYLDDNLDIFIKYWKHDNLM